MWNLDQGVIHFFNLALLISLFHFHFWVRAGTERDGNHILGLCSSGVSVLVSLCNDAWHSVNRRSPLKLGTPLIHYYYYHHH